MRPLRLELEGFTAFKERTEVDFDGVDLFALCGPTGAGKTSLIDAITFALYGSVPRLGEKAVAPVVTQGRNEAKVRLDFTVGGDGYSVARVVRGTSTKESRLVRLADGEVLADKAREVTTGVESLLGLDFRQFTTCVSLPQGEFARFLHADPRDRQDLLVKLLGWGLYDTVRDGAVRRASAAETRRAVTEGQLGELVAADEAAEAAAGQRVATLTDVRQRVEEAQPELDRLSRVAEEAMAAAAKAGRAVDLLDGVAVPGGVAELAAEVQAAAAARDEARAGEERAVAAVEAAEKALASLPPRRRLEVARDDHVEHVRLTAQLERGETAVADALAVETKALDAAAVAEAALADADDALHAARTASLAHTLAAELVVGEPCPVCRATVTEAAHAPPADVAAADKARRAAVNARDVAVAEATKVTSNRVRVEQKLLDVRERLAAVAERLVGSPPEAEVAVALREVEVAEAAVAAARAAAGAARPARRAADARVDAVTRAEATARRAFDAARDRVAELGPPAAVRADLAADWAELVAWVDQRRPAFEAEVSRHREAAQAAIKEYGERAAVLAEEVAEAGVTVGSATPRDAVAGALARAEADLERVRRDRARADELRVVAAAAAEEQAVARSVADHLKADRFERWLLDEALQLLVTGATERLRELSGGAYSLCIDDKSRAFAVVDHINAGHVRSARTLSGGETFLTSLALALALADQVAAMAAGAGARLETVLLDEGFGTLDHDALDVVASALEELGASGRMVGIVTHVQELAERLPVRYEVRKVGGAASVERVEA